MQAFSSEECGRTSVLSDCPFKRNFSPRPPSNLFEKVGDLSQKSFNLEHDPTLQATFVRVSVLIVVELCSSCLVDDYHLSNTAIVHDPNPSIGTTKFIARCARQNTGEVELSFCNPHRNLLGIAGSHFRDRSPLGLAG